MPEDKFIGIAAAAERLGCSPHTLRRAARAGTAPVTFTKIGTGGPRDDWMCSNNALSAFIAERTGFATAPEAIPV